jgi:hypothetical protein
MRLRFWTISILVMNNCDLLFLLASRMRDCAPSTKLAVSTLSAGNYTSSQLPPHGTV